MSPQRLQTKEDICRFCLKPGRDLVSLFGSKKISLVSKIMYISDIKIWSNAHLPRMICKKCIFLVEAFNCFKEQIELADQKLKSLCGQNTERMAQAVEENKRMSTLAGEEEDESEWEIQYISEEVKRNVEQAFQKKKEKSRRTELVKSYMQTEELKDISLAIAPNTSEKVENNVQQTAPTVPTVPENPKINDITINNVEETISEALTIAPDNNTEAADEMEDDEDRNSLQSQNFDSQDGLVIVTEEAEDTNQNTPCIDEESENSKTENAKNNREECLPMKEKSLRIRESFWDFATPKPDETEEINQNTVCTDGKLENSEAESAENNREEVLLMKEKALGITASFWDFATPKPDEVEENSSNRSCMQPKVENGNVRESFTVENTNMAEEIIIPHAIDEYYRELQNENNELEKALPLEKPVNIEENHFVSGIDGVQRENLSMQNIELANNHTNEFHLETGAMEIHDPLQNTKEIMKTECPETLNESNSNFATEIPGLEMEITESGECSNTANDALLDQMTDQKDNIEKIHFPPDCPEKGQLTDVVIVISSESENEENLEPRRKIVSGNSSLNARRNLFEAHMTARKKVQAKKLAEAAAKKKALQQQGKNQPRKYFQCTTCNISLYTVSSVLYHHNKTHTTHDQLLLCPMCEKTFSTKQSLFVHFNKHVEAHLYRCSYCTCEFVLKKNLQTHINTHLRPKLDEPECKKAKIDNVPEEKPAETQKPEESVTRADNSTNSVSNIEEPEISSR